MGKTYKEVDVGNLTVNVGIRVRQREQIIALLKYGESINQFVQDAVEDKLERAEAVLKKVKKK